MLEILDPYIIPISVTLVAHLVGYSIGYRFGKNSQGKFSKGGVVETEEVTTEKEEEEEETLGQYLVRQMREDPSRFDVYKDEEGKYTFKDRLKGIPYEFSSLKLLGLEDASLVTDEVGRIYFSRRDAWREAQARAVLNYMKSKEDGK